MSELPKQPIDIAIDRLQSTISSADTIRQMMITKLRTEVEKIELNTMNTGATILEAKMGVIKTLDDLLKSTVADANTGVKAILNKKETESNVDARAAALEVLKLVGIGDLPTTDAYVEDPDSDAKLEERLAEAQAKNPEKNLSISEDELEIIK